MDGRRQKIWMVNLICIFSILGLFSIASLALANVGVRVYKNITLDNSDNFKLRTSLSYVATKIRQADTKGKVYLEERDHVSVLVLEEEIQGEPYETLIYYYNKSLYELFSKKGFDFKTSDGFEVMEINEFSISESTDGTFELKAENVGGDKERLLINLRTRR